jgi:predicted kinase
VPSAHHGRLILLCGIPGSGKTTIGKEVAARLERCVHVQTDAIRAMLARADYSSLESRFVYEAATSVAKDALRQGYDVVLDATFPREEFRREAISRLRGDAEASVVVWVWCDPTLAYKRNSQRAERVPLESFLRLWRGFEPPGGALRIDSEAIAPGEAAEKILGELARI